MAGSPARLVCTYSYQAHLHPTSAVKAFYGEKKGKQNYILYKKQYAILLCMVTNAEWNLH